MRFFSRCLPCQGDTWLAGEARSERFEMGRDDLFKCEVGLPEQLLERRGRARVASHELVWYLATRELNVSSGKLWGKNGRRPCGRHAEMPTCRVKNPGIISCPRGLSIANPECLLYR